MSHLVKIKNVINGDESINETSKNVYIRHLTNLFKYIESKKITDLKNFDFIKKKLNEKFDKDTTIKTYINSILKYLTLSRTNQTIILKYKTYLDELNKKINKKLLDNTLSKEETESSFISYPELVKMLDIMPKETLKQISEWFFMYLVISHPLRLDYYNLPFRYEEIKFADNDKHKFNYIIYNGDKEFHIFLNSFKNYKTFGSYDFKIESEEIKFYMDRLNALYDNQPDYLYLDYKDGMIGLFNSKTSYSNLISSLTNKYLKKKLSNTKIREIYTTNLMNDPNYFNISNLEKEEKHNKLLHNQFVANKYYKKIPYEEVPKIKIEI